MNPDGLGRPAQQALIIIAIIVLIGSLHLARSAIVPVLFAMFLALLLSPAVNALARIRVPRELGAALVMVSLVAMVAMALNATWRPARGWLDAAPATVRTLERKLRPVTRIIAQVESVSEQAGRVTDPAVATDAGRPSVPAIADKSAMQNTQDLLIATVSMLIVTYFLLAAGPSLLIRFGAAWSGGATDRRLLQIATTISEDLGRYFATVTLSNLLLGLATTASMHWLDMPNPVLWGVVAFLLCLVGSLHVFLVGLESGLHLGSGRPRHKQVPAGGHGEHRQQGRQRKGPRPAAGLLGQGGEQADPGGMNRMAIRRPLP